MNATCNLHMFAAGIYMCIECFHLLECVCEPAGTLGGSTVCDKETGQCPCREHLVGLECTECEVRLEQGTQLHVNVPNYNSAPQLSNYNFTSVAYMRRVLPVWFSIQNNCETNNAQWTYSLMNKILI